MWQVHHKKIHEIMGVDMGLAQLWPSRWLAYHFGKLVEANQYCDRSLKLWDRVVDDPERATEALMMSIYMDAHVEYCHLMSPHHRRQQCRTMFTRVGIDWHSIDSYLDDLTAHSPMVRPRGDT